MPVTEYKDILSAIKTGLNTNPSATLVDILKRERRYYNQGDASATADEADDIKRALTYVRQTATVIAAAGIPALQPHLATLARAWATLPANDADQQVVDQQKVRSRIRNALGEAVALGASGLSLVARLEDFKRRLIGDYQASDPCETKLAAALTTIKTPANQLALEAAIAVVKSLEHLVQPTA